MLVEVELVDATIDAATGTSRRHAVSAWSQSEDKDCREGRGKLASSKKQPGEST